MYQVFFRAGVLNTLEDKRNEKLSSVLTAFQAQCRGYLARKRFERKKVWTEFNYIVICMQCVIVFIYYYVTEECTTV